MMSDARTHIGWSTCTVGSGETPKYMARSAEASKRATGLGTGACGLWEVDISDTQSKNAIGGNLHSKRIVGGQNTQ
jgi:hypothetical protein